MTAAVEMNRAGKGGVQGNFPSLAQNMINGCIFFFLSWNIVIRVAVVLQYQTVLHFVVFSVLLGVLPALVSSGYFKFLLFLFACSLPFYGVHSYLIQNTLFELFVSAFSLLCLVQNIRRGEVVPVRNELPRLLLFYILLACLSLLLLPLRSIASTLYLWGCLDFFKTMVQATPESTLYPLASVNRLLLFFVFIHQLSRHCDRDRLYKLFFTGLVVGAVSAAFLGILNHYSLISLDWFRDPVTGGRRLQSVFGNPGWFAEYLSISIPFILIGFLNQKVNNITKLLLFGVLIVCEVAILLTYSRTGWLIYPLVLVSCWFVFYLSKRVEAGTLTWGAVGKTTLKVIVSVPLTILISYFLVTGLAQKKESGTTTMLQQRLSKISNPAAREKIWQESMAIGREAPVFGMGYESYKHQVLTLAAIPESQYSRERQIKQINYDTPHSLYVQLFISNGVVGLCLWLFIVSYAILLLCYDLKAEKRYFNIAVLLSIIAFHQYGLAQSMQYISVIWFLIFLSFGYTMTLSEEVLPRGVKKFEKLFILLLGVLTVTGAVVYSANFESRLLAKKYGVRVYARDQDANTFLGFYPREDWGKKGIFRWTGRKAVIKLGKTGVLLIEFVCTTPGLDGQPVVLEVSLNGTPVDRITFGEKNREVSRTYTVPPGRQPLENRLEFRVSRTWNPRQERISADSRNLGVAVGEPKFL